MEVHMPSKKRPLEKSASTSTKNTKAKKKAKKEEEEEDIYKWWEEQDQSGIQEDDSIKWTTLEHNGVMFPPDYVPHGVKMKYDGKPITLSPEAEEVATFFANILESEHAQNPVFQKNFFNDWLEVLRKDPSVSVFYLFLYHRILIFLYPSRTQKSQILTSVTLDLFGKNFNGTKKPRSKCPRKKNR